MFSSSRSHAFRAANNIWRADKPTSIPDFLLPAFSRPVPSCRANFSSSRPQASRIGLAPVPLPEGVKVTVSDPPATKGSARRSVPSKLISIEGPLGKMTLSMPPYMTLINDLEGKKVSLAIEDRNESKQREMWGTSRAYLNNYIMGVSEGHSTILRLNGVGYRALIEKTATTVQLQYEGQEFVNLKVGYSHPIELGVPKGVKATTPQPTRILLEGADKEVINEFAAKIRRWRVPEPYKGKGIFVNGETIRLKAKKIK